MAEEQRQRRHQVPQGTDPQEVERTTPRLSELSTQLQHLLQEGDQILAHSLSQNAPQFLQQMRQQGGE